MHLLLADENASWLAPYAYSIVMLGFAFAFFRAFENWYAGYYNQPLFRHYFVYRKLNPAQIDVLEKEFLFYQKLNSKYRRQFRHRVSTFIADKKFVGRQGLTVDDRMKTLVAAVGCMLSFGRKNYQYGLIEFVLLYPDKFYSSVNDSYHKGEFNPREKALVLSWKHVEASFNIDSEKLNVGLHEFMHAMQLEARQSTDIDSSRFLRMFQNILHQLTNKEIKLRLDQTKYFKEFSFSNQYEFMAILTEYFIESPEEFKAEFPEIYHYTRKLLNFKYGGY
jgi:Mlc titration factor MtfA (ptsG expression regulator)